MSLAYTFLAAVAVAGLIAGAGAHTFFAAAAAAVLAAWAAPLSRRPAKNLYVSLDPQTPDGTLLLAAFRQALALISRTRQPVRLRVCAFTRHARPVFKLDLNRDADLELSGGSRRACLKNPGVWLPDHPLPLALPHDRSVTLLLAPCGAVRVRASLSRSAAQTPAHGFLALLLAAAACALDADWLLAGALGYACQSFLLEKPPLMPAPIFTRRRTRPLHSTP